jgi:small subunit ribosomal protein S3Ae
MSFGKNPKIFSKGRKGAKKKQGDRFLKKEWWTVRAPGMFVERNFTKSPANITAGKKLASQNMIGRVYEVNLGELNNMGTHKKIKLIVDDVSDTGSKTCLTNFYGLDTTTDHLCSLVRKWHTLVEAFVDAKTSDGFLMRFFVLASTKKNPKRQLKATTFAQTNQVKQIRKIMVSTIMKEVKKGTLKELVPKILDDSITDEITKKAKKIFPIQNCIIRKVKTTKRPRIDSKLIYY